MPRDIDITGLRTLRSKFGLTFTAGQTIFKEGDAGTEFYVILSGEVEMLVRGPDGAVVRLAVLRVGDFFGEMAAFREEPRTATARARVATALLYFSSRSAVSLLANSPRFGLGIIRTLCDRIASVDHQLVTALHALEGHRRLEAATSAAAAAAAGTDTAPAAGAEPDTAPAPPSR